MEKALKASIRVATRRNVFDALRVAGISWHGELDEVEFLGRIINLASLPSDDYRFSDAAGDIWQHRVNNDDWDVYWFLADKRINLLHGPDEVFLQFVCEMAHPLVRSKAGQAAELALLVNDCLLEDGWEIVERAKLAGKPVFAARPLLTRVGTQLHTARDVTGKLDSDYIVQQLTRMEAAVADDPELAIGTAKEFVETVCKTILSERQTEFGKSDDLPKLVRQTLKTLKLVPDEIPDAAKASDTIRVLLSNLATVGNGLAELRNPYGTGHGKSARARGLKPRHARLAVGAASTLAVFLFETHVEQSEKTG